MSKTTGADISSQAAGARIFGVCVTLYLAANMLLRWLRTSLLRTEWGLPPNSAITVLELALASLIPVFVCGLALTFLFQRGRLGRWLAVLATMLCLMVIEGDMNWYSMSHQHTQWHDLEMFLTSSWTQHFGLRTADFVQFGKLFALHLAVIGAIFTASQLRWTQMHCPAPRCSLRTLLVLCAVLCVAMKVSVVAARITGEKHLTTIADANPLYIGLFDDQLVDALQGSQLPLLAPLNAAIRAASAAPEDSVPASLPVQGPGWRPNILVVGVESWNFSNVTVETMPFFTGLRAHCVAGDNHYSTGNMTLYGVIGLLSGRPVVRLKPRADSPLRRLAALGYRTYGLGGRLEAGTDGAIRDYLNQFSQYTELGADDWGKLDKVDAWLRSLPTFVYVHYWSTHFWYKHGAEYARFEPETAPDITFDSDTMYSRRQEIVNRYRNTLVELDAWLRRLFGSVDLANTIVVLTGDHGEEMFETGRLAHGATLEDPQVKTPLLICAPGVANRHLEREVTAHADIMPTLFDLLGLTSAPGGGTSIFQPGGTGIAVIANNNNTKPPKVWRIVTGGGADARIVLHGESEVEVQSYRLPVNAGEGPDAAMSGLSAGAVSVARSLAGR